MTSETGREYQTPIVRVRYPARRYSLDGKGNLVIRQHKAQYAYRVCYVQYMDGSHHLVEVIRTYKAHAQISNHKTTPWVQNQGMVLGLRHVGDISVNK